MKTLPILMMMLLWQCAYGQWYDHISTFTTQDGLSNNTVTCLQKDAAGFLWIGTHEGLNRYDGTEFINVLSNTKNNLPSNNIIRICLINSRLIAVGTDLGLCLLNTVSLEGKKILLPFNVTFNNSPNYIENLFYNKATGTLWVCTWHGLFVLDEEGKLQKKITPPPAEMGKDCFAKYVLTDNLNRVYFFSPQKKGFYYPDFERNAIIPVEEQDKTFTLNNFIRENYVLRNVETAGQESTCILAKAGPSGSAEYMFYHNGLTGQNRLTKLAQSNTDEKRFFNAFPMNDSVFLINAYFGEPQFYHAKSMQVKPITDHPLWFTSWPDGLVASLCKDESNIWIGTSKGLLQASLKTNFFKTNNNLVNTVKNSQGLVAFTCGVYQSDKFWVACMGAGLFGLDTLHNSVQVVFDKKTAPAFKKKIVSTDVFSSGQSLWLFSIYGPVKVDAKTNKLSVVEGINKDPGFDDYARLPMKDSKGNIWVTLPNGISRYTAADNLFTNYSSKYQGGSFPLLKAGVKAEDGKGNIWMARQDSLVKLEGGRPVFSMILLNKNGQPLRPVTAIASDGGDILYMAIAGSFGIYHISTGNIDLYSKQTGIISTTINDIVSDKDGNAWIGTEGGLVFYNKEKLKFSSFTKADGLPDDEITGLNFADSARRILFLGFAKTYCLIEPKNFLLEKAVPLNVITNVEADGESIDAGGNQKLSYKQNSISFSYTGINFNQGQQNNYACMLEGFDQEWKYPGTERKVNYINLPSRKYTFKVKSANHQGEWNEQPAVFTFEITPPFWLQWWFITLIVCLLMLGIFYMIKSRDAAFQKENSIKLQMSELRMQALRAQMNPHFIFNSLNSIQNYILSNNTIDAAGYLSKFAKLMRRILDQSKHNFLPLSEVMETLKMYVEIEAFRFNNEFSYSFSIEENDDLLDAMIPPMLLQPFVENAILHGLMPKAGDKILLISCGLVNNKVEITIDDNGIGRTQHHAKAGHTSQGEKLTTGILESLQQIQNIKASMEIIDKKNNEMPAGTTIKLILSLK